MTYALTSGGGIGASGGGDGNAIKIDTPKVKLIGNRLCCSVADVIKRRDAALGHALHVVWVAGVPALVFGHQIGVQGRQTIALTHAGPQVLRSLEIAHVQHVFRAQRVGRFADGFFGVSVIGRLCCSAGGLICGRRGGSERRSLRQWGQRDGADVYAQAGFRVLTGSASQHIAIAGCQVASTGGRRLQQFVQIEILSGLRAID